MLTSRAREMLSDAEWVIVDEIHAVAQTKRGAHLALTLERLEHLRGARSSGSGCRRPSGRSRRSGSSSRPLARMHDRRRRHPQAARPTDPRAGRGHAGAGRPRRHRPRGRGDGDGGGGGDLVGTGRGEPGGRASRAARSGRRSTPSCSSWCAHRSTTVFVNSGRGAERLAVRLNELAAEEDGAGRRGERSVDGAPAGGADHPTRRRAGHRARHHGSLAREEREVVEEFLKSGQLPCLAATSSLELGIDMGAVDLVLQVESPSRSPVGSSGSAARATAWARSRGVGSSPVRAHPLSARSSQADAGGRDRADGGPTNRLTCSPSRPRRWSRAATSGAS